MKKASAVKQTLIGRPRTGTTPLMGFRADPTTRASIVKWAENQPDTPSLSEAIRRLVEIGLTVKSTASPSQRPKAAPAERAKELAAKAIEQIIDTAASMEDRTERKRRLTKGPSEFREVRVDQPKPKR